MRTTLSIDDDVLDEVRKRAQAGGETMGQAVSHLLWHALRGNSKPIGYRDGFQPLPVRSGQLCVTLEIVNTLRDEFASTRVHISSM